MSGSTWTWLLVGALVLLLLMKRPSSAAPPAPGGSLLKGATGISPAIAINGQPVVYTPPPPSGGSGSTSVADRCRQVFSYNDPSRYVGHQDQRVQAVSTANSALSTINCGAVGIVEGGVKAVGSWIGGLF
jgi:hypothetical protein